MNILPKSPKNHLNIESLIKKLVEKNVKLQLCRLFSILQKLYTSTLRLLGRFTTCFAQTTTASRLLFALNGTWCLRNEKKIENFRF